VSDGAVLIGRASASRALMQQLVPAGIGRAKLPKHWGRCLAVREIAVLLDDSLFA